ncbi:MAG: hydroxyacylglutathione hydrolase family protein [Planctomycetota bacterium]|jgi:glyoxylase-like metal-dependent hydrolase (beta-lactamase superfamily II)
MDFVFEQIRVGGDRNLGYLVGDRKAAVAAAIDPAFAPELFAERAGAQGLEITHILNTHGHGDHVNGNDRLKELTGAAVGAYKDSHVGPDLALDDGDTVAVGSLTLRVLHLPGHSPDHLLFWLAEQRVAITGDLLFVGKIGGTATEAEAREEYESLQRLLKELPGDTTIWPGHDYGCRPASTIALELLVNPFLQAPDFRSFLGIKADWARFKAQHGLI